MRRIVQERCHKTAHCSHADRSYQSELPTRLAELSNTSGRNSTKERVQFAATCALWTGTQRFATATTTFQFAQPLNSFVASFLRTIRHALRMRLRAVRPWHNGMRTHSVLIYDSM
jgi:hypothetical protein